MEMYFIQFEGYVKTDTYQDLSSDLPKGQNLLLDLTGATNIDAFKKQSNTQNMILIGGGGGGGIKNDPYAITTFLSKRWKWLSWRVKIVRGRAGD